MTALLAVDVLLGEATWLGECVLSTLTTCVGDALDRELCSTLCVWLGDCVRLTASEAELVPLDDWLRPHCSVSVDVGDALDVGDGETDWLGVGITGDSARPRKNSLPKGDVLVTIVVAENGGVDDIRMIEL